MTMDQFSDAWRVFFLQVVGHALNTSFINYVCSSYILKKTNIFLTDSGFFFWGAEGQGPNRSLLSHNLFKIVDSLVVQNYT